MAKVDPIPADYPRVTPYLTIEGGAKAIDFYCDILGAKERVRMDGPDGKVGHAELQNRWSCSPTRSPTWAAPRRRRSEDRP
jgi:hypothetical protein